jgi:hypothetical protein
VLHKNSDFSTNNFGSEKFGSLSASCYISKASISEQSDEFPQEIGTTEESMKKTMFITAGYATTCW